ncbi:MAG: ComF family protein [Desulfovibrio sp.]|nr:ComF family protein [Desulfovibrio sp.]
MRPVLGAALLTEARCPACGAVLAAGRGPCPDCAEQGRAMGHPCPGCAEPGMGAGLCARCVERPRPWGVAVACGAYEGRLKELILAYKFEGRLDCGRELQETLLAGFEEAGGRCPELLEADCLVPVPLHPRRLLSRGFNQSREIARLLAARRRLPILQGALSRVRRTTPQMELAREERAENIRGAFAARAEVLEGRNALLVDDIMTTGATLEECARAMCAAGAKRVDVLVLARA